jgi:hypothetical protein
MIRQIAPQFFATEIVATIAYYKDKLGFECLGTWQDPPAYAIVARDSSPLRGSSNTKAGQIRQLTRKPTLQRYALQAMPSIHIIVKNGNLRLEDRPGIGRRRRAAEIVPAAGYQRSRRSKRLIVSWQP